MPSSSIWIVSPCFFDVASFTRVIEESRRALTEAAPELRLQFILIDDSAGVDPDVQRLAADPQVTIVSMPFNMGHQAALVYALRWLGSRVGETDYVLTMDSDGEDRPGDLPSMLAALRSKPEQLSRVALAWRTHRQESGLFKLAYACFKVMFLVLTGLTIRNGNFAGYRGWFLKELIHHPHFDQCYASSFISLPLQIEFVPLPRGTRFFGRSKMGYMGLVTHGLKMLMPFTEKIATRGFFLSAGCTVASALLAIAQLPAFGLGTLLAAFATFFFASVSALFLLLFATFSQSKALSLRRALLRHESLVPAFHAATSDQEGSASPGAERWIQPGKTG